MKPHVINTCKSSFFHLHNIRRIRKYLSRDSTEKLIHEFVSSRLDYCNGLLYGLPKSLISKLQRVQNTAARIVYCMPTFCHITPLLFDLHWLPVKFRIDYKIIITAFKCLHNTAPHYLSSLDGSYNLEKVLNFSSRLEKSLKFYLVICLCHHFSEKLNDFAEKICPLTANI